MNKRNLYWITTSLAVAGFALGGVMDLAAGDASKAAFAQLGYPAYLLTLLGAWKLAGALAIAAPRLPRLKEWAYAGMMFDLTGAAFSHAWSGVAPGNIVAALGLLGIVLASWALRPAGRKLTAAVPAATPARIEATVAQLRAA